MRNGKGQFVKGSKPWNTNTKGLIKAWNKGIKGLHFSPQTEFKKGQQISPTTQFKKESVPWNKNKKGVMPIAWNKGKKYFTPSQQNEKHYYWKGINASYSAKHKWVYRKKGKAEYCSFNPYHIAKRYEWANISGVYLRDIDDYAQLCRKCHHEYDRIIKKGKSYK